MSALGLAAAAGCIGTGVVALTSDVLPYQGWAGGDHQRPDGSQLLPGARITQLAATQASPLNTGGFAPTLFVSAPVTRANGSTASAGSPALRSTKPGTVVVTRRSTRLAPLHHTSRSQGSTGDARQHTADAPTTAAPAAPVTSAVAAVATPAPAATPPRRPAVSRPRSRPSRPSRPRAGRAATTTTTATTTHRAPPRARPRAVPTAATATAARATTAATAPRPRSRLRRRVRTAMTTAATAAATATAAAAATKRSNRSAQAAPTQARPQTQPQPAPAAPAAPAQRQGDDHGNGDHSGHGGNDRGGSRRTAARPAAAAPAPAPAPAPAAAPLPRRPPLPPPSPPRAATATARATATTAATAGTTAEPVEQRPSRRAARTAYDPRPMRIGIITGSGTYALPGPRGRRGGGGRDPLRPGGRDRGQVRRARTCCTSHATATATARLSSQVTHQANIAALRDRGAQAILAVTVCGALDPGLELGTLVVFDDLHFLANRLPDGSICTLHTQPGAPGRGHWIFDRPFAEPLRPALLAGAREIGHAGPRRRLLRPRRRPALQHADRDPRRWRRRA